MAGLPPRASDSGACAFPFPSTSPIFPLSPRRAPPARASEHPRPSSPRSVVFPGSSTADGRLVRAHHGPRTTAQGTCPATPRREVPHQPGGSAHSAGLRHPIIPLRLISPPRKRRRCAAVRRPPTITDVGARLSRPPPHRPPIPLSAAATAGSHQVPRGSQLQSPPHHTGILTSSRQGERGSRLPPDPQAVLGSGGSAPRESTPLSSSSGSEALIPPRRRAGDGGRRATGDSCPGSGSGRAAAQWAQGPSHVNNSRPPPPQRRSRAPQGPSCEFSRDFKSLVPPPPLPPSLRLSMGDRETGALLFLPSPPRNCAPDTHLT